MGDAGEMPWLSWSQKQMSRKPWKRTWDTWAHATWKVSWKQRFNWRKHSRVNKNCLNTKTGLCQGDDQGQNFMVLCSLVKASWAEQKKQSTLWHEGPHWGDLWLHGENGNEGVCTEGNGALEEGACRVLPSVYHEGKHVFCLYSLQFSKYMIEMSRAYCRVCRMSRKPSVMESYYSEASRSPPLRMTLQSFSQVTQNSFYSCL